MGNRSAGEMMKNISVQIPILVFALALTSCANKETSSVKEMPSGEATLISQIRGDLPEGWQCASVHQDGEKGHPHGLAEPLFRTDFSAPEQSFQTPQGDKRGKVSPLIQLYFYDIATKAHVLNVIDKERIYSWDIPIYFGETEDYIIVTSPSYVNHGIFTEEAKKAIRPMWNVLRNHIENKGDKMIDELAQPDK